MTVLHLQSPTPSDSPSPTVTYPKWPSFTYSHLPQVTVLHLQSPTPSDRPSLTITYPKWPSFTYSHLPQVTVLHLQSPTPSDSPSPAVTYPKWPSFTYNHLPQVTVLHLQPPTPSDRPSPTATYPKWHSVTYPKWHSATYPKWRSATTPGDIQPPTPSDVQPPTPSDVHLPTVTYPKWSWVTYPKWRWVTYPKWRSFAYVTCPKWRSVTYPKWSSFTYNHLPQVRGSRSRRNQNTSQRASKQWSWGTTSFWTRTSQKCWPSQTNIDGYIHCCLKTRLLSQNGSHRDALTKWVTWLSWRLRKRLRTSQLETQSTRSCACALPVESCVGERRSSMTSQSRLDSAGSALVGKSTSRVPCTAAISRAGRKTARTHRSHLPTEGPGDHPRLLPVLHTRPAAWPSLPSAPNRTRRPFRRPRHRWRSTGGAAWVQQHPSPGGRQDRHLSLCRLVVCGGWSLCRLVVCGGWSLCRLVVCGGCRKTPVSTDRQRPRPASGFQRPAGGRRESRMRWWGTVWGGRRWGRRRWCRCWPRPWRRSGGRWSSGPPASRWARTSVRGQHLHVTRVDSGHHINQRQQQSMEYNRTTGSSTLWLTDWKTPE